jgi:GTP-dependent phosphoenolpyruvate carboxykinase
MTTKIPDSGSGMPDLGHDAYWLMKHLPAMEFKDTNGKMKPLSAKYEIASVKTNGSN